MTIPAKQDALLKAKLTMTQQLLNQYVELAKLRETQVRQITLLFKKAQKYLHCLTGMLAASLIVNAYLIHRFF